jgi:hypothetical protein
VLSSLTLETVPYGANETKQQRYNFTRQLLSRSLDSSDAKDRGAGNGKRALVPLKVSVREHSEVVWLMLAAAALELLCAFQAVIAQPVAAYLLSSILARGAELAAVLAATFFLVEVAVSNAPASASSVSLAPSAALASTPEPAFHSTAARPAPLPTPSHVNPLALGTGVNRNRSGSGGGGKGPGIEQRLDRAASISSQGAPLPQRYEEMHAAFVPGPTFAFVPRYNNCI